jgi:hypothetical protein
VTRRDDTQDIELLRLVDESLGVDELLRGLEVPWPVAREMLRVACERGLIEAEPLHIGGLFTRSPFYVLTDAGRAALERG